jgi:hypothetical protein
VEESADGSFQPAPGQPRPAGPVRLRLAPARGLLARRLRTVVRQVLHGHVLRRLRVPLGCRALRPKACWQPAQLHRPVPAPTRGPAGPSCRGAAGLLAALPALRGMGRRLHFLPTCAVAPAMHRPCGRLCRLPHRSGTRRSAGRVVDGSVRPTGRVTQRGQASALRADSGILWLPIRHVPRPDARHGTQAGLCGCRSRCSPTPRSCATLPPHGPRAASTASRADCCTTQRPFGTCASS